MKTHACGKPIRSGRNKGRPCVLHSPHKGKCRSVIKGRGAKRAAGTANVNAQDITLGATPQVATQTLDPFSPPPNIPEPVVYVGGHWMSQQHAKNEFGETSRRLYAGPFVEGMEPGTKGGLVSTTAEVGQFAWIAEDARVCNKARVEDHARVLDGAIVSGNAIIRNNAEVSGDASVGHNAVVEHNAKVTDLASVYENATVGEQAKLKGRSKVKGKASVKGQVRLVRNAEVSGNTSLWRRRIVSTPRTKSH